MNQTQRVNLKKLKSIFNLYQPTKRYIYYDKDLPILINLEHNDCILVFSTDDFYYPIINIQFKNPYPTLQEEDLKDIIIAINDYLLNSIELITINKYI